MWPMCHPESATGRTDAESLTMKADGDQGQRRSLAKRLNALFAMVRWTDPNGRQREYSTSEVAKAVTADPSHPVALSRSYLAMLRNGSHSNPTLSVLDGLAKFFDDHRPPGTPPITVQWLVTQEDPEDELLQKRLADHHVQAIAMRAGAMTPATRKQLLQMIAIFDQDDIPDLGHEA
jgi:transcriptional regulator with XRE-family HTH domain